MLKLKNVGRFFWCPIFFITLVLFKFYCNNLFCTMKPMKNPTNFRFHMFFFRSNIASLNFVATCRSKCLNHLASLVPLASLLNFNIGDILVPNALVDASTYFVDVGILNSNECPSKRGKVNGKWSLTLIGHLGPTKFPWLSM